MEVRANQAAGKVRGIGSIPHTQPPPLRLVNQTPSETLPISTTVAQSLAQSRQWIQQLQDADGSWCGYLDGDSILESEYVLLQAWLGKLDCPKTQSVGRALLRSQLAEGGWGQFPDAPIEISASVKAYFALKLLGYDPELPEMQRARQAIRDAGGADCVNSFTRFYLALLGQIDYRHCPAVPPEAILLPKWMPINMYRISAWSRTMLIPLALVWATRPKVELAPHQGIEELFLKPADQWPRLRAPGLPTENRWFSWESTFYRLDRFAKWLEQNRIRPLRSVATKRAIKWMTDRFVDSDGLGAIFPPIVWSRIALTSLGFDDQSPEVRYCDEQLDLLVRPDENDPRSLRVQPCKSPVWDTALVLRGIAGAGGNGDDPEVQRAIDWLLSKQVTKKGDWSERVKVEPGGWFFEYHNEFYPDIDDTIMVLMALRSVMNDSPDVASHRVDTISTARRQVQRWTQIHTAAEKALNWVIAMQNRDGGWGAFDRDNDAEFLCYVPFADHNAMIDPSTPDIAGRVIEALAMWGYSIDHPAIQKALAYLRQTQEADGSWFGRWGVNYIYGTWQVLVGLRQIGISSSDPMMARGANWLQLAQQPCGGWGESPRSYEDVAWKGEGVVTASQTAWGVLGLLAARGASDPAVQRGIKRLLEMQNAEGTWDETEMTGTGFPRVFYLRYWLYPHYFPMMALGEYKRQCEQQGLVCPYLGNKV